VWQTAYRAAWVHPVSALAIADGAVIVEGDRIAWVGPAAQAPGLAQLRVVDLGDVALTPGLVNAHTHLDLTVMRGLLDGTAFFDWIRGIVAARAQLNAAETLDSARLGAVEALEAGITTVADTSPTTASLEAMAELGLRGTAYLEAFGPDPRQAEGSLAALRSLVAGAASFATPLQRLGVSPHAPYSVSDELYRAVADWARAKGLPVATHVAESEAEQALVTKGGGMFATFLEGRGIPVAPRARTPVALLGTAGVLGPHTLAIHCVRCDADDVAMLRSTGTAVATCPASNAYFGHGRAPVAALRAAGVRVGIGTDSMASNTCMDLRVEAETAGQDRPWLAAATMDGAAALGLGDRIGRLEPGYCADLAAFPLAPGTRGEPAGAPALLTVVGGVERQRAGRVAYDADALRTRTGALARRLREWRAREARP
jgi:5-methylthioadenosine/S-adenosylhomocysteine deaminase